jgi:hypothetical protein
MSTIFALCSVLLLTFSSIFGRRWFHLQRGPSGPSFLFFGPFSKDSLKYDPGGKISKLDPDLGAIVASAKI